MIMLDERYADVPLSEIVDAEDFGKMVNVDRLTIHAYRKHPDKYNVPEPAMWAAGVPYWTKTQVREWQESRAGQGVGGGRSSWKTTG